MTKAGRKEGGTHKLCKLVVADAAVGSLEALGVEDAALRVDVAETDGGQDLHRRRLLRVASMEAET